MGWIQIKMGYPLAQNGAALAPFRASGAHFSTIMSIWVEEQASYIAVATTRTASVCAQINLD